MRKAAVVGDMNPIINNRAVGNVTGELWVPRMNDKHTWMNEIDEGRIILDYILVQREAGGYRCVQRDRILFL